VTKHVLICDTESEQDQLKVFHETIEAYFADTPQIKAKRSAKTFN